MTAMILGRVIAGLGGNGMYLGALTLLSVFTNPRETPAYIGYLGLMWGLGTVIGPIIGGAFAISRATWRWGFYINLVIGGLSFPVYFFALPSFKPQPTTKVMAELRRIDWIGAVLVMSAFVAGVMAISFGGTLYTWDSGQIIALFVVSGVLFIALALQQVLHILTTKTSRILPVHFFAQKDMFLLFVVQASVAAVVVIPVYYIPLFFQFAQGDSAIRAGVKILPLIITLVTLIVINGHMMGRFRFYQPWYLVGSILYMLAAIFLSRMTRSTSNSVIYGLEVLLGIGTGCYSQASFAVAQKLVDPSEIHNAISFILIAQLGGTTIGLCLAGAIFQNEAFNHLRALLPRVPVDSLRATITGTGSAVFEAAPPPLRVEILDIIVTAIGHTMILVYVAGALCLVCACFLTPKRI
ncbi:MAG: hypothetical protein M1817_001709 [Caeruleum heppii]|nr:MAG: hypothetical protein M1817_001709 [Caeruleum heppii]